MGRPLPSRFFGANADNNFKVQFYNGSASVPGYIVKQYGSERFKCRDANGNTAICRMVAKASGDLGEGEMSMTVKYDDGTSGQLTKIARYTATVNGSREIWSFNNSTTDTKVQFEEAGTDTDLTDADDFEGDDGPAINGDYPVPGSGSYKTAATALSGINFATIGTPWVPTSVSSVSSSTPGLLRKKYDGNFCATYNALPATWDYSFFDSADFIKSIADEYVSWGQQLDGAGLGEHNFSVEWKGYFQVPSTQNYNMYAESDDQIALWVGTAATDAPVDATRLLGSANKSMPANAGTAGVANANTMTLTAGQWYPIRIWFSEFNGGCKAQIYLHGADGTKLNGDALVFAHDPTEGSGF